MRQLALLALIVSALVALPAAAAPPMPGSEGVATSPAALVTWEAQLHVNTLISLAAAKCVGRLLSGAPENPHRWAVAIRQAGERINVSLEGRPMVKRDDPPVFGHRSIECDLPPN